MNPDRRPIGKSQAAAVAPRLKGKLPSSPAPRVGNDVPLSPDCVDLIGKERPSATAWRTHAEQVAQVKALMEECNRRMLEHMSSQLWAARSQSGSVQLHENFQEYKRKSNQIPLCEELDRCRDWQRPGKGNGDHDMWYAKVNDSKVVVNGDRRDRADTASKTSCGSPLIELDTVQDLSKRRTGVAHGDALEAIANTQLRRHIGPTRFSSSTRGGLLPDLGDMKKRVKESIQVGGEFNVSELYHTRGCAQMIARSHIFETMTLCVIVCNALWISIEQDHNDKEVLMEAALPFQIGENAFCFYFVAEWLIRYFAFERKCNIIRDRWFIFDTFLVMAMVGETWVMGLVVYLTGTSSTGGEGLGNLAMVRLVRLLRLTRMARIVRLLRAFPELIMLVKAIGVALRAVFFTMFLLLIITYMFAIALTQLTQNSEIGTRYFDTVPDSMKHMLISSVFPDLADILEDIGFTSWLWLLVFLFFLFTISLTLMNMLIGFLVEVVKVVAEVENEQLVTQMFTDEMMQILAELDENHNLALTGPEFTKIFWTPHAVKFLTQMDVDVVALVGHVELLFKGDRSLGYADIISWLLELRGTNHCTVKDIVELRKYILEELRNHTDKIRELLAKEFKGHDHEAVQTSRRRSSSVPPSLQSASVKTEGRALSSIASLMFTRTPTEPRPLAGF